MAPPPLPSAAMTVPEEDSSRPRKGRRASTRIRTCSGGTAAERLTDDILVEILSRVPAKSLCRFKCVSPHWLGLTKDPHHRKKLPQTVAGFFHDSTSEEAEGLLESRVDFTNIGGTQRRPPVDTSFAFLPGHRRFDLLDCRNGLLLFRWFDASAESCLEFRYLVCNPATEKWAALPECHQAAVLGAALNPEERTVRLAFDPAVSPHFHVFLLEDQHDICHSISYLATWSPVYYSSRTSVAVYSSETGGWVHKRKTWDQQISITRRQSSTVFLDGKLHLHAYDRELSSFCLAAVDTDAETWTNFAVPGGTIEGFIQLSQGRLHYANLQRAGQDGFSNRLAVYVLQDYEKKEWILKHSIHTFDLARSIHVVFDGGFDWIVIHPQYNLIYFTLGWDSKFICYDMDRRQAQVICNLEECKKPYLPYVPLYAELPSLPM
ncbi:F-box protein At5g07610 [Brachypodium distachyon]|uniref:F-box domain-containing protein n=1 Tax=Brachypodium distachyon TaxID=15368 RepID=A0A0Q3NHT4_BRADI|nr:F-box protein At5g07610 [Brachypodium distachyon]KQK17006.1 hypothetical protein BRADI_1g31910v3 [Brachypodium distachyon]|eukprot:XP_010240420.1 F-box protein At5g07610 [Brachypodium distachyon]